MCTLIHNKTFDEEEDLDRILEGTEFDVEEMMDSPSLIEDDGSQERTEVVKGSVGELRGRGPCHAPTLSLSIINDMVFLLAIINHTSRIHVLNLKSTQCTRHPRNLYVTPGDNDIHC